MSTRSAIVVQTPEGFQGIYCHFDGYPGYVGKVLEKHYQDPDKVARLVALGDISCLDREVEPTGPHNYKEPEYGVTVAYHRDRGEEFNIAEGKTISEVAEKIGHNGYVYVFSDGKWTCNGLSIEEAIKKDEE